MIWRVSSFHENMGNPFTSDENALPGWEGMMGVRRDRSDCGSGSIRSGRVTRYSEFMEEVLIVPAPVEEEKGGEMVKRPENAFGGEWAGWV